MSRIADDARPRSGQAPEFGIGRGSPAQVTDRRRPFGCLMLCVDVTSAPSLVIVVGAVRHWAGFSPGTVKPIDPDADILSGGSHAPSTLPGAFFGRPYP